MSEREAKFKVDSTEIPIGGYSRLRKKPVMHDLTVVRAISDTHVIWWKHVDAAVNLKIFNLQIPGYERRIEKAKTKAQRIVDGLNGYMLFDGEPSVFGGLSNEQELMKRCSEEFLESSPWSDYAYKMFERGVDMSNWKWNAKDQETREHQKECLVSLLRTYGLGQFDKEAVAGWMLSVMLKEVPKAKNNPNRIGSKKIGPFYTPR